MANPVYVLNGPNLNCLGEREPAIYGIHTLEDIQRLCEATAAPLGLAIEFRQSNHEGVLVDWIQEARKQACAIIINPAGYTPYSLSILDALKMVSDPKIEIHLSNIHARDAAHSKSIISAGVDAVICGLGPHGYQVAVTAVHHLLSVRCDRG